MNMFAKFAAACLIVLGVSPFTAPFRTCELVAPKTKPQPLASLTHAADSIGAPAVRVARRIKVLAQADLGHSSADVPAPLSPFSPANSTHRIGTLSVIALVLRL
jgi:hypothetical protein